jgi:hypothetical protein
MSRQTDSRCIHPHEFNNDFDHLSTQTLYAEENEDIHHAADESAINAYGSTPAGVKHWSHTHG